MARHKNQYGEYDLWKGYDGVWYWQIYKPAKDRLTSGSARTKTGARTQAIDMIKRLISPSETWNPLRHRI